jgi:hypothetical protein
MDNNNNVHEEADDHDDDVEDEIPELDWLAAYEFADDSRWARKCLAGDITIEELQSFAPNAAFLVLHPELV